MPTFSIKNLLITTTLIGVGLCLFIYSQDFFPGEQPQPGTLCGMTLGCALIGAGILTPFKHPWFGVVFGILAFVALFVLTARQG